MLGEQGLSVPLPPSAMKGGEMGNDFLQGLLQEVSTRVSNMTLRFLKYIYHTL